MSAYILIMVSAIYGGAAITTLEFSSQERCEAAAKAVPAQITLVTMKVNVVCVAK